MALIASKRKATQSVDVSGIFIWFRAMTVCVRLFDCALYLFVDFLVGATSCSVYIHLKCSEDSYSCHSKTLRPHLSILKWHLLHWPGAFRVAPFFLVLAFIHYFSLLLLSACKCQSIFLVFFLLNESVRCRRRERKRLSELYWLATLCSFHVNIFDFIWFILVFLSGWNDADFRIDLLNWTDRLESTCDRFKSA